MQTRFAFTTRADVPKNTVKPGGQCIGCYNRALPEVLPLEIVGLIVALSYLEACHASKG